MTSSAARQELIRLGTLLYARRYVVAAEGNLSIRLDNDRYLITAAGACKGWLQAADLLEIDGAGRVLAAAADRRPSSEWRLHCAIYARCPEAGAVCHAHPPFATACAAAGRVLDVRVLNEQAHLLGAVPLVRPTAAGTEDVALAVRDHLPAARALLLGNHGAVAWGGDLVEAYFRLEYLERLAEVTLLGELAGGARRLPDALLPESLRDH